MNVDDEEEEPDATELEEAQIRIMDLEEQLEELQEQLDSRPEPSMAAAERAQLTRLQEENSRLTKLKEDADVLEAELMEEVENLSGENEKLENELKVAKNRIPVLEADLLAAKTTIEAM